MHRTLAGEKRKTLRNTKNDVPVKNLHSKSEHAAATWSFVQCKERGTEKNIVLSQQAYFYLEVWPLLGLFGLLLRGSLELVLLLVSFQPPQLLLYATTLLPHLLSVLLVKDSKLSSAKIRYA